MNPLLTKVHLNADGTPMTRTATFIIDGKPVDKEVPVTTHFGSVPRGTGDSVNKDI